MNPQPDPTRTYLLQQEADLNLAHARTSQATATAFLANAAGTTLVLGWLAGLIAGIAALVTR